MPLVGKVISHYEILEQLGGGGMGIVYKAKDTKLKRTVALKFLPPALTADPESKERFIHEAQAASALQDYNICVVHDVDETADGQMFISMEYLDGETLKKRLERGPLKIDEAVKIAIQIAQGLTKAHDHGIIHRDIKPANIMVTTDGVVKIVDFGLAKLSGRTMLTKMGSTLGTAAYMSPEQARGELVDHRTDIWSLGVVLYEMLTGKRPFDAEYENALIYSIVNADPEPVSGLRTGIPLDLERIVKKCLMKAPAERYQHIDELTVDLKGLSRMSSAEGKPPTAELTTVPRRRRAFAYALGTLAVVAIVAATMWLLRGGHDQKGAPAEIKSIAVLPPRSLMKVPGDEPLSEGILEGLITELGKIRSLSTIGRQSVMRFNGTDKTYAQIAAELGGVDAIVEPSFQHVGNKLQINARLIRASDGKVLWSGMFDKTMDDILVLQSEVAQTIAREIRVAVTPQEQTRLASARPVNAELYQIYLQGRYHFAQRTLAAFNKSIRLFQQVLDKDPDNALAYAGLAESYGILPFYGGASSKDAFPKAKSAALKALELDNSLAEAHTALGFVLLYWDWDWAAAERELLEAIELKQSYVVAHHWYAEYLSAMGRHEQAFAEIKRAQELDPLSPLMLAIGGEVYILAGRYDEAIEQCRKSLELDPNFALAHDYLSAAYRLSGAYRRKGMYKEYITEAEKADRLYGSTAFDSLMLETRVYAMAGARAKALETLGQATQLSKRPEFAPWGFAHVCTSLGEKNRALDWLEKSYDQRNPNMVFLNVDHELDALHSERRFQDLVRRMNFPAPALQGNPKNG
jgi:TolB-like protein/predicted Ser/Thr protein kinase